MFCCIKTALNALDIIRDNSSCIKLKYLPCCTELLRLAEGFAIQASRIMAIHFKLMTRH